MRSATTIFYQIFEWSGFLISIAILSLAMWERADNTEFSIKLFLFSPTPFLSIKLLISALEKEAIISGMPNSVKLADNPKLYWLVISAYGILITLSLILTII